MTDVLTPAQRRLNMQRIRGKDTAPEMTLRRLLHAAGFRYRLHDRKLPGRPDLVFPRFRVAMFVHGCFWHGHACPLFKLPTTRREFWETKIAANKARDSRACNALSDAGWRVLTVWECSLKGPGRLSAEVIAGHCERFISGRQHQLEICGNPMAGDPEKMTGARQKKLAR